MTAPLRRTAFVKAAIIPSVRVEPELRAEVESLLGDGETISEFVEASIRGNRAAPAQSSGVHRSQRLAFAGGCAQHRRLCRR
jgi:hypothetical protein